MSDIDTAVVDSLKALDPEWPIREADIKQLIQGSILRADYESISSSLSTVMAGLVPAIHVLFLK